MNPTDEIKQKLDIVDVVGSYIKLKKSGKNYKGLCPFHGEKTPSFMVSPELQIFKCFGCNESGDMFSFIQKIEGVEFVDALKRLGEKADVKIDTGYSDPNAQLKKQIYFINNISAKFYHHLLTKTKYGKEGLTYLKKKRGLSDKTIKDFMVGYAPKSWDVLHKFLTSKKLSDDDLLAAGVITRGKKGYIDKFIDRIIFPFIGIDGKILGFNGRTLTDRKPKYLNTSESLVFNKSFFLYGLDKAKVKIKTEGAILVEGQMDVLSAHQNGLENVIASSGTALTGGQLKILSRYTNSLTFCFDADSAGVNAVYRGVDIAENFDFNTKAAIIPPPYKDLDDLLTKDKDLAEETIKDSLPIYDYFIITSLKKHDKNSAYGKKKIINELSPRLSKIKNKVVLDHYIRELSEKLDLSEETVSDSISQPEYILDVQIGDDESGPEIKESYKRSPEHFFIALLLRGNIDIIRDFMYKIELEDIENSEIKAIYSKLDELINADSEFSPQDVEKTLSEEVKPTFTDLYMWDMPELSDDTSHLVRELDIVIKRIKNKSLKRQLSSISEGIKRAEEENDKRQLKKLTVQFNNLSKQLNKSE